MRCEPRSIACSIPLRNASTLPGWNVARFAAFSAWACSMIAVRLAGGGGCEPPSCAAARCAVSAAAIQRDTTMTVGLPLDMHHQCSTAGDGVRLNAETFATDVQCHCAPADRAERRAEHDI